MGKGNTLADCRNQLLNRLYIAHNEVLIVKHNLEDNLRFINETQAGLNKYKTILHGFLLAYRSSARFDVTDKQIEMAKDIVKGKQRALHYLFLNRKYLKLKHKAAQRRESKALRHLKEFDVRMKKQELENGKR